MKNNEDIGEGHNFKIIEDYFGKSFGKHFKIFILKCDCCGRMITNKIALPRDVIESNQSSRKKLMLKNQYLMEKIKKLETK